MPEGQVTRKRQSITFDTEVDPSPSSDYRLQKALIDVNTRADPKDSVRKECWVDKNAKALFEAFAKGKKAESSTCGYSELSGKCWAKEGTTQDLRYTLVGLPVRPCCTAEANRPSRRRYLKSMVHS